MKNKNLCERMRMQRPYANDANHAHTIHNNTIQSNTSIGRTFIGAGSKNFPEISVSLFENYKNPVPIGKVSLDEWLFSDQYRETVEAIRAEENKARRDKLKAGLPAITPSGTFSYRNKSWLILHSNLICIDIDQKDNPGIGNFSAIKDTLADNASLYYTGLSASGNGLFVLFRIAYSERHAEHYHALVADLEDIGLIADLTCSDVSRLRGASYDPEPYYNPMAVPYEKLIYPPTISVTSTKWQNPSLTAYRVERIVERIREDSVNIAEHYRDWYDIGRSLAAEFGEYGRQWYHAISRQSSKYNPTECSIQYAHCLKTCSRTSIATFFGICKRHGLYAN